VSHPIHRVCHLLATALLCLVFQSAAHAKIVRVRAKIQKHRTLGELTDTQFEDLLGRVSAILSQACKLRGLDCQITIDRTAPLEDFPDLLVSEVQKKLKPFELKPGIPSLIDEVLYANRSGIFPVNATAALLDGTLPTRGEKGLPSEVTVFVVQKISNGCPGTPLVHVGGCAAILGSSAVIGIRPELSDISYPKPGEWTRGDQYLWAHEFGHLLGLWDLDRATRPSRLMGTDGEQRAAEISKAEGQVVCAYPPGSATVRDQLCRSLVKAGERSSCESYRPGERPQIRTNPVNVVGAGRRKQKGR
jgi:hypothetical protein